ncbi:MAG: YHS domain-containing protein [Desulfobulbaceae bacterium]|nr:MAG: YHS domain-containing protein [Desulfobulbaceae bacterium]
MHPIKIIILLILIYLLYRLYMHARKKRVAARKKGRQVQGEISDVLVQDSVCGAYVPRGQALIRHHDGREFFFCSEQCCREFEQREPRPDSSSGSTSTS